MQTCMHFGTILIFNYAKEYKVLSYLCFEFFTIIKNLKLLRAKKMKRIRITEYLTRYMLNFHQFCCLNRLVQAVDIHVASTTVFKTTPSNILKQIDVILKP